MGGPAPGRWWRRGRDEAQAQAREAAGRAAPLLIDLDRLQSEAAEGVRLLRTTDPGRSGPRVAGEWEPVQGQANQAVAAYLAATGIADPNADLEEPVARHLAQSFHGATQQLGHAIVAVQQFLARNGGPIGQARSAYAAVPDRIQAARVALTTATRRVETAQQAGYQAREAAALVEEAFTALQGLDAGVATLGLSATLDGATRVIALAERAGAEADAAAGRAEEVTRKVTSARTFLQVTEGHLEGVPEVLTELRRGFVYPSFADVEGCARRTEESLQRARDALAEAQRLAGDDEQRYGEAEQEITNARAAIEEAAKAAQAPRHRLTALREVQADPQQALAQARRVVRDAQRFLVAGPEPPRPELVSRLDAVGRQLDTAPDRLAARNRPDFWAYLSELAQATNTARQVIDQVRQSRGAR